MVDKIQSHFELVIKTRSKIDNILLQQISLQMYDCLQQHIAYCNQNTFKNQKWIWIDNHGILVESKQLAITANETFPMSLEPILFALPKSLTKYKDLF